MDKQTRWDLHFLRLALAHAEMSKDPSTKVGAIIVGPDLELRSAGFNGFPRGIADTDDRLNNKLMKYKLVVHAELNAILAAATAGISTRGCALYVAAIGAKDDYRWGGPPCVRCTVEIIQAGITSIIGEPQHYSESRWSEDADFLGLSPKLLAEAGVSYREVG